MQLRKVLLTLSIIPYLLGCVGNTIKPGEAIKHIGEKTTVCGEVVEVTFLPGVSGNPTFMNLEKKYPDHVFTVVIWGKDRKKFNESQMVLYQSKRICVSGIIKDYRGKPQIVVDNPSQIEIQ